MSQLLKDGDRLVLAMGEGKEAKPSKWFDFQLLSPLLLGLMVPFVAARYFDPEALENLQYPIWVFLVFMLFVCTGLFIYTVHFPGKINKIIVDRGSRSVEIVWASLLSMTSQIVPFQEISALKVRNSYDDDGASILVAELVLSSKLSSKTIVLPTGTNEEHLRPLRAAIGLG